MRAIADVPKSITIQNAEQRIADLLLIEHLRNMKMEGSNLIRDNIGYVQNAGNMILYRAFQIKGITFWLDTDVMTLPRGIHKVFLYKGCAQTLRRSKATEIIGAEKIPAILFVGDYNYFDCFDGSEYILMVYPGCYFTSTSGRSWTEHAMNDKNLNQMIEDCKSDGF